MSYWKVLTSEFRPPLQGGKPLCDGKTWPVELPTVPLDRGWHFCRDIQTALKSAGFWRTGHPNAVILVEPHGDIIELVDKLRAASLTLKRLATDKEIYSALTAFSTLFGEHRAAMAEEQWLWWQALAHPTWDREAVIEGLTIALRARSLHWTIKEYPSEKAAWDAWAWTAWAARDAWDAWDERWAWDAARALRDAVATRDAWGAGDAWAALTLQFAARSGWISHSHDLLTVGIRDAYRHGLFVALPTGPNELGFVMEPPK